MEKKATRILQEGEVRNLTDRPIPPEAILGKGFGFVPTPSPDPEELPLDTRLVVNQINLSSVPSTEERITTVVEDHKKDKLRVPNYHPTNLSNDRALKQAAEHLSTKANTIDSMKSHPEPPNLSQAELRGLEWLRRSTEAGEIAITKADKGGAILVVPPRLLEQKIAEKVNDPDLYVKLNDDPRIDTYERLYNHWLEGKTAEHVTTQEAKKVMGITENNTKSTSSIYKYGVPYFSPSLKIHKLDPSALKPGCDIPARLILAAQDGVTKRSDVFIQQKWLTDLQNDFCKDLVTDSNETLNWLDRINELPTSTKTNVHPFTFDFKSLYESLDPYLVREAVITAMEELRPNWSNEFKNWLIDLWNRRMITFRDNGASRLVGSLQGAVYRFR